MRLTSAGKLLLFLVVAAVLIELEDLGVLDGLAQMRGAARRR